MARPLLTILLASAVFATGGCSTPPLVPKGTASVTLDGVSKKGALTVGVLDEVAVDLPPVKTPGYIWELFYLDHRYLKITTPLSAPNADGLQSMKFITGRPGRTLVRFLLIKQNARESDPLDAQEIVLTIEG